MRKLCPSHQENSNRLAGLEPDQPWELLSIKSWETLSGFGEFLRGMEWLY